VARPILVGRPSWSKRGQAVRSCHQAGLFRSHQSETIRAIDSYVQSYSTSRTGYGVTPDAARTVVRTNATVIAALAVVRGEALHDLAGSKAAYDPSAPRGREIVGFLPGREYFAAWR